MFCDQTTDTLFAIKKYAPKGSNDTEDGYQRFVQEVKILFNLSHPNIVRVYNHYLYPEARLGYIQMEYINGIHINNYEVRDDREWNDIFIDIINAFRHLEENKILHRDVRPENILIDADGNVKIIDFGFGKQLTKAEDIIGSILLNWPVTTPPHEIIKDSIYDHRTEVFFVGKLFSHLDISRDTFRFYDVLEKMTCLNPKDRYESFSAVATDMAKGEFADIDFSHGDKKTYQEFADGLLSILDVYNSEPTYERAPQNILQKLADILRASSLEENIQLNNQLLIVFIDCAFSFFSYPKRKVSVLTVKKFYDFFSKISERKQHVVLDNLYTRLSKVKIKPLRLFDDVPF